MSGTSRCIPQTFLEVHNLESKGEERKISRPKLGLEVPDTLLSDVGDQPKPVFRDALHTLRGFHLERQRASLCET